MRLRAAITPLVVGAALAVGLPAAGAAGDVISAAGPCGTTSGPDGQGGTAGTNAQICMADGAATVGPAIGQIATVGGSTIAGPASVGTSIVAAGNVVGG